jgi:preprotein translocase subunit SecE
MSAQRRVATKQRKTTAPRAQGGATSAKQKSEQVEKPATKPQTQSKAAAAPRESVLKTRYANFLKMVQNTWAEIKKVTWPDAETTRNLTLLVIVMSTVLGLLLGGIDFLLLKLFESF